jgi:hypothetical protein
VISFLLPYQHPLWRLGFEYCTWRAITRVFKRGEAHRIGKLTEVLSFIWRFDRVNRPRIEAARLIHGPDVPIRKLTNAREIASFLSLYGVDAQDQT